MQPFPGTPDASPRTEIAFPALTGAEIRKLIVRGSHSGIHRGRLLALPAGHGTAFLALRPFSEGERVSVQAALSSPKAGTASGAPGATRISFSFTVAEPAPITSSLLAPAHDARNWNGITHSFHSEGWLHPPILWSSGGDPDPSEGDIFADAENSLQAGPLIFNSQGQLIYFRPLPVGTRAFNVEMQSYRGQTVLTYWQGIGVSTGHGVVVNHNYHQVAAVYAGNGYSVDAHEFQLTPQGDAFVTVYAPVRADLSSLGGPGHGILMDSIIQEIDVATGQLLWEWHASGHVSPSASYAGTPGSWPYDFFHINSIQPLPGGKLLVSARHTWAVYEISMRTGRILFTLGGKHSTFKMGRGTNFEWQHDARMQPDGTITVFDNATNGPPQMEPHSRALRIRLNFRTRRAALVSSFTSSPPQLSAIEGSVQPLSDGNTFVGWGSSPYFTEFGRGGRQLFSLRFSSPVKSYRALRFQWWGQPTTPPSIATATAPQGTTVYASWNGATQVASWRVLAGPSAAALAPVGQYLDTSFETTIPVASTQPYFEVQALDASGNVLGTSAVVAR